MGTAAITLSNALGTRDGSAIRASWPIITANPGGEPLEWLEWADRTWQYVGTNWGGATLVLQGSNDLTSPTNWFTLSNAAGGTAASFTSGSGGLAIIETPIWVRPYLSVGGTSAVVDVSLVARRQTGMRA